MAGRARRILRRGVLGLLALFLLMQLVPAERSNPPIRSTVDAPAEVLQILRRSCFDCHSHETRWPWYSRVAPFSWWLAHHVDEGRGDLNFSEWPSLDFEAQDLALHDIEEQILEGKMPLRSYLILHREARLGPTERETLLRWARGEP